MADYVRAWSEVITIPTYGVGEPLKQPLFLDQRVYQGSSGVVYPYPVIDSVNDEKAPKPYTAVFLENEYLKIMLLPELGGRVQMALDKTNDYHFVYYNRVIKPALVGLTGPWISGGIEFNWPQHHRPSTFDPVDWRIVTNADGSVTVWCSEIERMFFTKGMHGFTLHPDKAVLQIDVQLHNRTDLPQTFLWWANPAVHVNDEYQSVFPPDVHAVMDHGKRDVSEFPIAKGTYYKVNYAPGTDISRYKNIPVPTSYMAYHSDFDFVGNYDHGRQAGMMHVANHHLVPGKKQWTWGNSDFGLMWDRQLTDEDGPYIELMCGAFTDNQPDFSWLMPGEEKHFQQNFLPYKRIGPASNANTDAVVHLSLEERTINVGVYVTSPTNVAVQVLYRDALIWQRETALSPTVTLVEQVQVPIPDLKLHELTLVVTNRQTAQVIMRYTPPTPAEHEIPPAATAAADPRDITSTDELFLNGLHLEQYRHATYRPEDYYLEALRRDPLDSRCNNAMGLLVLRRGDAQAAVHFFQRAIKRQTSRNPNPYDGEAYYNLGQAYRHLGKDDESVDAFYKATWNAAWQDAAFFELARISARRGDLREALQLTQRALRRNWSHQRARHLEIMLYRQLGNQAASIASCTVALTLDPMEPGAAWEQGVLGGDTTVRNAINWDMHACESLALDYLAAGDTAVALQLCAYAPQDNPLIHYLTAAAAMQAGDEALADVAWKKARGASPDLCFPHRIEHITILRLALQEYPEDGRAAYYLGNYWYAHRMYDSAIEYWQHAVKYDPTNAVAWRNLGLGYVNQYEDLALGQQAYATARQHDPHDARLFYEADQLARKAGTPPAERLTTLTHWRTLVNQRDDLTIEYVTLLNIAGRHQEAFNVLMARTFHPWEGGEGRVAAQYVWASIGLAQQAITRGEYQQAITQLTQALQYPHNLGEGKLPGSNENHVYYVLGNAYAALDDAQSAQFAWQKATRGDNQPTSALYYNDQPPDMLLYQGWAWQALNQPAQAEAIFRQLVAYADAHQHDDITPDYFAVSLPTFLVFNDDAQMRNQIHCHYMRGLGLLGLGDITAAQAAFAQVLTLDANHHGAHIHRQFNK
jgi:tetratricopeptide (TPR) repeat protein